MPDSHKGPQQPNNAGQSASQAKDQANQVKDQAKQAVGQVQEAARPYIDQAQQGAQRLAEQAGEHLGSAREGALRGYRQAEGAIARNPAPAMLIGFGVGFGLGVVLCSLLGQKEETWAEKYLPDSLRNVPDQANSLVGSLKKKVPDQYESLIETLKDLPQSVAAQLPRSISKFLS